RGHAGFLTEAADSLSVFGEARQQQLERDLPAQLGVARQIDLAHSSAPDLADDLVMANRLSGPRLLRIQQCGGHLGRRRLNESLRATGETDQRFNLAPQLMVITAGLIEKSGALRRLALQRFLQQLIYLLPAFRSHKSIGEWGMGSGEWGTWKSPHSPLPIPHSPIFTLCS